MEENFLEELAFEPWLDGQRAGESREKRGSGGGGNGVRRGLWVGTWGQDWNVKCICVWWEERVR